MNEVLPIAEKMLREYGEFYPYGGYIDSEGKTVHLGAKEKGTDRPDSKFLLQFLTDTFGQRAKHGFYRATAIVYNVVVTRPDTKKRSDAIQVCLDHKDNYSAEFFFPYELVQGCIVYGETFAQEGKQEI